MAVRLNADGTLDPTFGSGGKATYNLDSARKRFAAYGGAVQPDGSVVLAGVWYDQDSALNTAALRRYTPGGQLDASFGTGGPATGTVVIGGVSTTKATLQAVGLDPAGNVVAVGTNGTDSLVVRVTPSGAMDDAFAAGLGADANPAPGVRVVQVSSAERDTLYSVAVGPDGRVLAAGVNLDSIANGGGIYLLRLSADGDNDWSFDGDGVLEEPAPDPWLLVSGPELALQDVDGTGGDPLILLASGGYATPNVAPDQVVARFYPDGSPDASFGTDGTGMAVTNFQGPLSLVDGRPSLQDDGKLVFVGTSRFMAGDLLLGRLNADGTPDTAFGPADGVDDAVARYDFGAFTELGREVITLPDGKLLVVGDYQTYDWTTSWGYQFLIARFNPDGTLDDTFGDGGKTLSDFGGNVIQSFLHAAVQGDGKIVAAGIHQAGGSSNRLPIVVRYTEDGQPDWAFGDGGKVLLDLPGRTEEAIAAIASTADGKVVVSGNLISPVAGSTARNSDRFVARLNDDGTLDTSFGPAVDGVVILDNGSREEGSIGLAVGSGGALFVAGTTPGALTDTTNVTLTKLAPGGAVDLSFGTNGTATIPLPNAKDTVTGFRVTPQGQFLLSGTRSRPLTGNNYDRDFLVMRVDSAGVADATFGPGGARSYDLGSTADGATDALVTANGRIIVAGHSTAPGIAGAPYQWSAVRVEGDSQTPPPATVAVRMVFYNNSSYDSNRTAADTADDGAVAPDKQALLPGQAASFSNVSGYSRGINGVMVDVLGLRGDLSADDFDFSVGTPGGAWAAAPAPASVGRRPGAGAAGSDRVTLTWADGAVKNTWLRVTVKANAHTGLAGNDVFYFGTLVAETGDSPATFRVNALDIGRVKAGLNGSSALSGRLDFNRDGRVNALDLGAAKANLNRALATAAAPAVVMPVPESAATPGDLESATESLLSTAGEPGVL
jgi:uncharacterized delta-60 repeat protein